MDERTKRVFIDKDSCVQCLKCITQFSCSYNAIVTQPDKVPPGKIKNFSAISDSVGMLKIQFIASGDDDSLGIAYRYNLTIKNAENQNIEYDFHVPDPNFSGEMENWTIENLPENTLCNVSIQTFDEVEQSSEPVSVQVYIQGIIIDAIPPNPILDLNAVSDENSIHLTWTAPEDSEKKGSVIAYEIRYSENAITIENWSLIQIIEQNMIPKIPGSSEELEIENLLMQVNYQFAIRSLDASNNTSDISNIVTAQITGDVTPPAEITDLRIQNVSSHSIVIAWTCVGDNGFSGIASGYVIKAAQFPLTSDNWNSADEIEQNLLPLLSGETQTFLISNLAPLTPFYIAIKTYDEVGNTSPISNVVFAQTTDEADITSPASINDLTAMGTQTHIELSWTATGDDGNVGTAYQYDIRYATEEIQNNNWETSISLSNVPIPSPAGTLESMILTEFEAGEEIYFALKVMDESGNESLLSNSTHAQILFDTIPPAAVNDLAAEIFDTSVLLRWTATGDDGMEGVATFYDIRYHSQEITEENWNVCLQLNYTETPNYAGSQETYLVNNLNAGETYFFAIKVFDDNNNASDLSNNATATIPSDNIPPASITDLQIITGNAVNLSTIGIQWSAVGDDGMEGMAAHYEIRYSTSALTESNWNNAQLVVNPPAPQNPGSIQNFNITGLNEGTRYFFAIKVYDENENASPLSNCVSGKIVYQINTAQCRDCNNCINDCDQNAIYDAGPYKVINPDLCIACGDCSCPWNLIRLKVIAY
jgi:ferredoxin